MRTTCAAPRGARRFLPRFETILLILAFLSLLVPKALVLRGRGSAGLIVALGDAATFDAAVIAGVYALNNLLLTLWRGRSARRAVACGALLIASWSLADAVWLVAIGTHLRSEVLGLLINDAGHCWPIVWSRVAGAPWTTVVGALIALPIVVLVGVHVVRPRPLRASRRALVARMVAAATLVPLLWGTQWICRQHSGLGYYGVLLRPSTHVGLLRSLLASDWSDEGPDAGTANQRLARRGERELTLPALDDADLPDVVIVILESVGYWATTLADPGNTTTPVLAALAAQGVEFSATRVGITRTNKSMFTILAGDWPSAEANKSEGVLVDPPYESLATVLRRRGYRSAFFQMAKAESCHPPTFANLGFDHFWSRENLEDPSKVLTYLAGDDFAMLEPAFHWADRDAGPYLLVLMTSVAHDPYVAPDWYGPAPPSAVEQYKHCVGFTDSFIGAVRERLDRRRESRQALLCVVADHGEGFRNQHGLWGHLDIPFDEALRVPWVLHGPGLVPAGVRIDTPCHILDVTPTILAAIGFEVSQAGFVGANALGPLAEDRRHFFACWGNRAPRGYVQGSTKYVYTPPAGNVVRYDLGSDPAEQAPIMLSTADAEVVVAAIRDWERTNTLHFPANRFVKRTLFEHWPAWSSGKNSWAYYRP